MSKLTRLFVALGLCAQLALCQSGTSDWTVVQAIDKGHRIRVETVNKTHNGALVSASSTGINLTSRDGAQVSVPRTDVRRVFVQSKTHRIRNTIIGTAAGLGIGIAVYASLGTLFRNEGHEGTEAMLIVPIAAGAAIGAALPTGRMQKIYDVNQK